MEIAAGSFLQSKFWAAFKNRPGILAVHIQLPEADGTNTTSVQMFVHQLPGNFSLAYIPHGPESSTCPAFNHQKLAELIPLLKQQLPPRCIAIRFDLPWFHNDSLEAKQLRPALPRPFRKGSDVQPPDTTVLDLSQDEEALLAAMKPKWRYNIKLAAKKGVQIAIESAFPEAGSLLDPETITAQDKAAVETFYALYRETARRDRISLHEAAYYQRLLNLAHAIHREQAKFAADVRVWVARHEGEALASIVTIFHDNQAVYLYGASSDTKRNLMPAYLLQWEAIKAAKAAGCTSYDMYGIPPSDDPGHPMAGLYRFKTGFGGQLRHYAGCWDWPLLPAPYFLFRLAERLRLFWHKIVLKKLRRH
ncbi:MAG: peptidoglycan bridge formation glycyltransferase FemA/FemB family protein [Spirochaetes bacterium]|nr:peptidoglycan bridge formation glycyltransferase FemA/FemB family protein [Spirochaetota bacterium]